MFNLWYKHGVGKNWFKNLEYSLCITLTLIPEWVSYHIPSQVWDEITYPFQNFNGSTVKVWKNKGNFIIYPCWE